jgi:hypothetical protein
MVKTPTLADVPLAVAAQQLGISWQQAWRAVLVGHLIGQKRAGKWYVNSASMDALAERMAAQETA